jgi:hypothetical protein
MTPAAFAALAVITVGSVALWALGRRFMRRYYAINGRLPPSTWMFRRADDAELESSRRLALGLLPLYLLALFLYLTRP